MRCHSKPAAHTPPKAWNFQPNADRYRASLYGCNVAKAVAAAELESLGYFSKAVIEGYAY